MTYLTENIHIASCASRSDRQSPAQQLVCQRHQAKGRYCCEYLPFKLISLTNIQANYWWGLPNQNFWWAMHPAHVAALPMAFPDNYWLQTITKTKHFRSWNVFEMCV